MSSASMIPLMGQQPVINNPIQNVMQLLNAKDLSSQIGLRGAQTQQAQQQANDLAQQAQQRQRALKDQDTIRQALTDPEHPEYATQWGKGDTSFLTGKIDPATELSIQTGHTKALQDLAALDSTKLANLESGHKAAGESLAGLQNLYDTAEAKTPGSGAAAVASAWPTVAAHLKAIPGLENTPIPQAIDGSPGTLASLAAQANAASAFYNAGSDLQKKQADAKKVLADAAKSGLDATQQQRQQDSALLSTAASHSPEALRAALSALPPERQAEFAGLTKPEEILAIGQTPEQIAQGKQVAAKTAADIQHNKATEQISRGELGVNQAKQLLENKKFQAEYGTPDTRSSFTESVIKDPDSFFSLPPQLKPGVAADLVARGLNVPVQLPSELKSRAVSADLASQSIANIRQMLQDPDVRKSIGAWAGNLGNLEQSVGATVAGQSPEVAAKEQAFRTQLAQLKFQEARGILGGRVASNLMDQFAKTAPRNNEAIPLLEGALNGVQNNLDNVKKETRSYSFGGAGNTSTAPKYTNIRVGPGGHQIGVGPDNQWHDVSTGAILK